MSSGFLIFPNQLFKWEKLPLKTKCEYVLLEDPIYFGDREKHLNFNQVKLVLHRASMKYYEDYLKKKGAKVKYLDYRELKKRKSYPLNYREVHCFDPTDHLLMKKVKKIKGLTIHGNPNFLTPVDDLAKFVKGKKKFYHYQFYEWQKKRMRILKGVKSYDQENREGVPKAGLNIPKMPPNKDLKQKYIKEARAYVKRHFGKNYGSADDFMFPITHSTSETWFKHFLKTKFRQFGKYQDAIAQGEDFLFHSVITPMLNVGLLDPEWVVEECTKYYKKNRIPINNYEGYLRQVIGWREYSRMLYLFKYQEMKKSNYFDNQRKLTKKWYLGKTGVQPIDETIKAGFKTGYLHHILRLMMISNFMNLCQIKPDEVYKWFMEYSIDSYDWVMINNVYSMGLYADGGLTMRKPYLSTSNYILKMSNYRKDGYWDDVWNTLYYYFLYTKYNKLRKTAMVRNLGIWDRKTSAEKAEIKKKAEKYLKEIF